MYPPLAKEKGLNTDVIGYIFCLYPVGSVIGTSRLAQSMSGDQKKKVKKNNITYESQSMIIGLSLTSICMLGFALL